MSGRGMGKVFRCTDCALQSVTRTSQIHRRAFASSSIRQKHGAVPAFTDASSPELLNILTTLRERLILPAHLSKEQQSLIYKTKYHKTLITEPVTARIGGEDFPLKPIDRTKNIPNVRKSLFKAIELMETKSDWDNLPRLLEGLKNAGIKLELWAYTKIVRLAGQAGRQDVILECARQVQATGFALNESALVQQVVWWIQMKAVDTKFDAQSTKKALSWTEMVFELMEHPNHAGNGAKAGELDPRMQPEIVAILLQLAAVRASDHLGGKDEDGKVADYAQKLLGTSMKFGSPIPDTHGPMSFWLSKTVPVLHGMKVALKVLEPTSELATKLQSKIPQLEQDISHYKEALSIDASKRDAFPMGLEIHRKLLTGTF